MNRRDAPSLAAIAEACRAAPPRSEGVTLTGRPGRTTSRVQVKTKGLQAGDQIGGRPVVDFEPDGRIIFAKPVRPIPPPVTIKNGNGQVVARPTSLPWDAAGPTVVRAMSVNSETDPDEAEEVWDSGTSIEKLKAATLWLDVNYKSRNVSVGVELYGPAPRTLAALAALTQKQ